MPLMLRAPSRVDATQTQRVFLGIVPHLSGDKAVDLSAAKQEAPAERLDEAGPQRHPARALLDPGNRPGKNPGCLPCVDQFVMLEVVTTGEFGLDHEGESARRRHRLRFQAQRERNLARQLLHELRPFRELVQRRQRAKITHGLAIDRGIHSQYRAGDECPGRRREAFGRAVRGCKPGCPLTPWRSAFGGPSPYTRPPTRNPQCGAITAQQSSASQKTLAPEKLPLG